MLVCLDHFRNQDKAERVEAEPGVEPRWMDLQSTAWPFCHSANISSVLLTKKPAASWFFIELVPGDGLEPSRSESEGF